MTRVNRDVSRRASAARTMRSQATGWLVVVMIVVGPYLSVSAADNDNSYDLSFNNDCGRVVPTPLVTAVVLWLAFSIAAAGVLLTVAWSRHRRRARSLPWFPVRGIGLALACLGVLATAYCLLNAVAAVAPYHVFCPPSGP